MPQLPFLGQVMLTPYNFAPSGWAMCNGQLMSINQNTALFALLGTNFGGDGIQTFGLPNLQSRVPLNFSQGSGLTSYNVGDNGGVEVVTLTVGQIPAHTHIPQAFSVTGNAPTPSGTAWAKSSGGDNLYTTTAPSGSSAVGLSGNAIASSGGNQPHDNFQPYLVLNYCIALFGIFPSQN
jgi:microcystin-dependent protein